MPELVEVETTRRDLEKVLKNKVINKVCVYLDKIVFNDKINFIKKVEKSTIIDVKRRGKWLVFETNKNYIIIHFRMEGRFYLLDKEHEKLKHDYVIFYFDDFSLHYNDPRLFGNMQVIEKKDYDLFFSNKKLGLEYNDNRLTAKYLKEKFKSHGIEIKKVLLSQKYITGIGNIYADEILFKSKIKTSKKANKLTIKELNEIINNTKIVFDEALKCKGTYPNIDGKRGTYENHLKVYGRENKPCYLCGTKIKKIKISSRGTCYCPKCQK